MAKLVGIDYGTKRVGVAVSDESGSVAFPRVTLSNDRALLPTIMTIIREEHAATVVIGESKNPRGEDNTIMGDIRKFVATLEERMAIKVLYEPEFYSSQEARLNSPHNAVDAQAAAIILNSYIERTKPYHAHNS